MVHELEGNHFSLNFWFIDEYRVTFLFVLFNFWIHLKKKTFFYFYELFWRKLKQNIFIFEFINKIIGFRFLTSKLNSIRQEFIIRIWDGDRAYTSLGGMKKFGSTSSFFRFHPFFFFVQVLLIKRKINLLLLFGFYSSFLFLSFIPFFPFSFSFFSSPLLSLVP